MKWHGLNQRQRVLAALRRAGTHGVCQVDFLAPNVIDGGPPITRLAARVGELVDDGFPIRDGGRRHTTKVYVLDDVPTPIKADAEPAAPELFAPTVGVAPPRSVYDEAAA